MTTTYFTPDDRGTAILMALGKLGKHVYAGTVSPAEKTRRRAASKARAARRAGLAVAR
jgi:hypothetical protein